MAREVEPRPCDPHLLPLAVPQKFLEPVACNHRHIVVQKHEIVSLCLGRAEIVDGRIVKFPLPANHTHLILSVNALVKVKGGRVGAINLWISCQTFEAPAEMRV